MRRGTPGNHQSRSPVARTSAVTPKARGRHALLWVLGMAMVFVVVSAMALQAARRSAGERWDSVVLHCVKEGVPDAVLERGVLPATSRPGEASALAPYPASEIRGGAFLREWRRRKWEAPTFVLILHQERTLLASRIEALVRGSMPSGEDALRAVFAAVDVELVVEP